MPSSYKQDGFDWDSIDITPEEYFSFLEKIQEIGEVVQVKENLFLNEIRVKLNSWSTTSLSSFLSEYPDVRIIRYVKKEDGLEVHLRTTHWFMSSEELEKIRGVCTLKGMEFIKHEFDLFPNVTECSLQKDGESGELTIFVSAENIDSSSYFNEIISFANLYVKEVKWTNNEESSIIFAWDEEGSLDSEFISQFNQSKYHSFSQAVYHASPSITCEECGEECEPTMMMINNGNDNKVVDSFKRRQSLPEEYPCDLDLIRVPLKPKKESDVIRELDTYLESTEKEFTSVGIPFGYYCKDCDVLLSPPTSKMKEFLNSFVSTIDENIVNCEIYGEIFSFKQYQIPYIDWNSIEDPLHSLVKKEADAFLQNLNR